MKSITTTAAKWNNECDRLDLRAQAAEIASKTGELVEIYVVDNDGTEYLADAIA